MRKGAIVHRLRSSTDADAHDVGHLVVGPGALVDAQYTVAVAERGAANRGRRVHRWIGGGIESLIDDGGRAGFCADGDCPNVGLLLLVTGRLVDVEVTSVLRAGILNVCVIEGLHAGVGHGAGATEQCKEKERAIHVIDLQPVCPMGRGRNSWRG
ncbi:hypothetical protein D3C84_922550 [compost metagenome]